MNIAGYSDYLESKEKTSTDTNSCGLIGDSVIDDQYRRELDSNAAIMNLITNSDYVRVRPTDEVGIGTKCTIKFADGETKTVTLTEFIYGLSFTSQLVSLSSPVGQAISGKHEGDEFEAIIRDGNHRIVSVVKGTVEEIKKSPTDYLKFIRDKKSKNRMCAAATGEYQAIAQMSEEDAKKAREEREAITESQRFLLLVEKEQILRQPKTAQSISRLARINKTLETSKIAEPPTDGTIGIGSTFDVVITDGGNSETRHYEMINRAVSDELEDGYVEKIDTLGSKLFGKRQSDQISFRRNGKTYKAAVINVDRVEKADAIQYHK